MRLRASKRRAKSSNQINFDRLTWEDLPGQELSVILASAAVLIALAALAIPLHAIAVGRILVYGGSLLVAAVGLATALYALKPRNG